MIIPLSYKKVNIGDKVLLIKNINRNYFIAFAGHEFEVIDKNEYGYILKDPKTEFIIEFIHDDDITLKIDLNTAKKEYTLSVEVYEYKKFIKKNCPNKSYDYADHDRYDSCNLLSGWSNECRPELECSKHINKEKIKESKILTKHLRNRKIKKIEKL